MKLYYAPGACSIGIHFLLEELGVPYEGVPVIIREGEQFKPEYVALTAKSKVPALERDDGSVVTEFGAIAHWLGNNFSEKGMVLEGLENETRTIEMLDYAVATIHMQGFTRIFRPAKFVRDESDHDWVRQQGIENVLKAFGIVSDRLGDRDFILGDRLTIADCGLFYTLFWAIDRQKLDLPANVVAYYDRMRERPSAQKVFADEGIEFA